MRPHLLRNFCNTLAASGLLAVACCVPAHGATSWQPVQVEARQQAPSTSVSLDSHLACQALVHTRGLRAPLLNALHGDAASFQILSGRVDSLVKAASTFPSPTLTPLAPLVARIQRDAVLLLAQQEVVLQMNQALRDIHQRSPDLLEGAELLRAAELAAGAPPSRIMAAGQLVMLSQRIGKSSVELISFEGLNPDAVFLLGKDPSLFLSLTMGMRDGDPQLRLQPAKAAGSKAHIAKLLPHIERVKEQGDRVLSNVRELVVARQAQAFLLADSEILDKSLEPRCFGPQ